MEKKQKEQKLEADNDVKSEKTKREGFSAEELGKASASTNVTEFAQMMRRGDESNGNPNERDIVGASDAASETENQPFPKHQNSPKEVLNNPK